MASAFLDLLFTVSDLPPLIFSWLDPSSLALAACVCRKWRDTAYKVRGEGELFRLVLDDLVPDAPLLAWAAANLNEKRLPATLQKTVCALSAKKGALASLQWARENDCPWDRRTCANAARGGHLAVLQWARENGCEWDSDTCAYAAEDGHIAVLQWARENGCDWDRADCLKRATGKGHKEVAAWIASQPE